MQIIMQIRPPKFSKATSHKASRFFKLIADKTLQAYAWIANGQAKTQKTRISVEWAGANATYLTKH